MQVRVLDQQIEALPAGLYIPPDALRVLLEAFEGPLDLLLYLVKKQNLDILKVEVSVITEQYMRYIGLMQTLQLDLAAEYLVMAALLAEIKSQKLLPRYEIESLDEEDPRAKLLQQLQTYERFRSGAENLEALPRIGRDFFDLLIAPPPLPPAPSPQVTLDDLMNALQHALQRVRQNRAIVVSLKHISTQDRAIAIMHSISKTKGKFVPFLSLCDAQQGRMGIVVTFLALLELMKEALVEVVQTDVIGVIQVRAVVDA